MNKFILFLAIMNLSLAILNEIDFILKKQPSNIVIIRFFYIISTIFFIFIMNKE